MKRFLVGSAVTVIFAALSPAAFASEMVAASHARDSSDHIKPFNLVYGAYQGQFSNEGIPSSRLLVNEYERGRINAQDLIDAGIAKGRLPSEMEQNRRYRRLVKSQLQGLSDQSDSDR